MLGIADLPSLTFGTTRGTIRRSSISRRELQRVGVTLAWLASLNRLLLIIIILIYLLRDVKGAK